MPLSILLTRSRFRLDSLFLCESRLGPLDGLLRQVPADIPIYTAPQSLMDEIAGFPIHRGVLACARKGTPLSLNNVISAGPGLVPGSRPSSPESPNDPPHQVRGERILVLNQLSNHDNVGAAFRNAAAFGADGVILDAQSCDPLYRKAIRVSSGASLWLPYHFGGTGETHLQTLQAAGYEIWTLTPGCDAEPLYQVPVPDKLAIMLGAEGPGLPESLISAARPVRIPMMTGFDSVNVATAGAIALSYAFGDHGQAKRGK